MAIILLWRLYATTKPQQPKQQSDPLLPPIQAFSLGYILISRRFLEKEERRRKRKQDIRGRWIRATSKILSPISQMTISLSSTHTVAVLLAWRAWFSPEFRRRSSASLTTSRFLWLTLGLRGESLLVSPRRVGLTV